MKKKEQKKQNKSAKRSADQRHDLQNLDSQLGSFGLEPPKIYRSEQARQLNNSKNQSNKSRFLNKKSQGSNNNNRTPQQERQAQNKKRKHKNKLRKAFYIALIVICVLAVLVVLSLTVLFRIDTINVVGNSVYTTKEITAVLPISKDKNLFVADTSSAEEKLEQELPYIYNAEIKRKFPSTIVVNITEAENLYSVKNKDKTYIILDDNLKVLETNAAKKPKGSIEIKNITFKSTECGLVATTTKKQTSKDILLIMAEIKSLQLENEITAIYSLDINNNYMIYDGRITYKLGTTENLESKIYSALTATEKLNESNPTAEGEMTVTDDKQVYFTAK